MYDLAYTNDGAMYSADIYGRCLLDKVWEYSITHIHISYRCQVVQRLGSELSNSYIPMCNSNIAKMVDERRSVFREAGNEYA